MTPTLDPLQTAVIDCLRGHRLSTEELRAKLSESIGAPSRNRLSAILHDLRASGQIEMRHHCRAEEGFRRRQEWVLRGTYMQS